MTTRISAIVVTHESAAVLPACLRSLAVNTIAEVIVVDTASTDAASSSRVAREYGVTWLPQAQNAGFAVGCNAGAAVATGDILLFLNPDAALPLGAAGSLTTYLAEHPAVGAAGLLLCDSAGQPEAHSFGPPVTLTSLLLRSLRRSQPIPRTVKPQGWVSAGALVVRRAAFEAVGGFDPGFFMYWEDVDLCRRLWQHNWPVVLLPHVRVTHQRGASLADAAVRTTLYDQSADRYFRKHYAGWIWMLHWYSRQLYRRCSRWGRLR